MTSTMQDSEGARRRWEKGVVRGITSMIFSFLPGTHKYTDRGHALQLLLEKRTTRNRTYRVWYSLKKQVGKLVF